MKEPNGNEQRKWREAEKERKGKEENQNGGREHKTENLSISLDLIFRGRTLL